MPVLPFLAGAVAFGFFLAGLFFLRFWKRTGEPLFLSFAIAFVLFGVGQCAIMIAANYFEERSWAYLPRLAGFLLIIFAIARKNRRVE
jgi:hypothetical protein